MLEGNIFTSGGHGSSGGKRLVVLLVALAAIAAISLAGGGLGSVVDTAVNGQASAGGASSGGAGSGTASPGFPGVAFGFVFLLVSMLVLILRM